MHFKLIGTNLFTGAKLRIKIKNILFSLQHLGMLISNFDIFFFFFCMMVIKHDKFQEE